MNETTSTPGVFARAERLKLAPGSFIAALVVIYLLGLAAQFLTASAVPLRFALWPFLLAQVLLTALWYGAHAARLRDAGRSTALAQGVVVIHILAVVLLILIGVFFMESLIGGPWMPRSLLLVQVLVSFGHGATALTYLGLLACLALLIPPVFSVWAALQPKRTA